MREPAYQGGLSHAQGPSWAWRPNARHTISPSPYRTIHDADDRTRPNRISPQITPHRHVAAGRSSLHVERIDLRLGLAAEVG